MTQVNVHYTALIIAVNESINQIVTFQGTYVFVKLIVVVVLLILHLTLISHTASADEMAHFNP